MTDQQPEDIFYDRSRVSLDWKCRRARYWGNEYKGLGVVPMRRALYFDVGDVAHKGAAALAMGEDLEETCHDVVEGFRHQTRLTLEGEKLEEQACLVEGMLRGLHRQVLPGLLAEHTPLLVENEFLHRHDGCVQGVKPDLLTERQADRTIWYWEWKTTGSVGESWANQWPKAIQLHTTALAAGQHLGREVRGVIVQGIYKGYVKEGKQTSIFCYGYTRPGNLGGAETLYEWKPGARRVPVWQMPGGIKAWIDNMPAEVLANQFVQAPPVFLQTRLVAAYQRQTAMREKEIVRAGGFLDGAPDEDRQILLDRHFPQNFNECAPAIGAPCAWADCCFNPHVAEDPIASGIYNWREPHHSTDAKGLQRLQVLRGGVVIR
jgi:hypothetical protein